MGFTTVDDAIDQLKRNYKYSGAVFQAALFADNRIEQLVDVDKEANLFVSDNHGLITDCRVAFDSTGSLPSSLVRESEYYVVEAANEAFKVSAVKGGEPVNLTDSGTGSITVIEQPLNYEDSFVVWKRAEVDYKGSSRQLLDFSSLEPALNPSMKWVEFPELVANFNPKTESITYRYFAVIVNNLRLRFIEDYETTLTIEKESRLGFRYRPVLSVIFPSQ